MFYLQSNASDGWCFNASPAVDFVGGKRTGVSVFLGDTFELRLSVDGRLSQGDERSLNHFAPDWNNV